MENVTAKCIECYGKLTPVKQGQLYCSKLCKQKAYRNKKRGVTVTRTPDGVTHNTAKHLEGVTVTHTPTDQLFIADAARRGLVDGTKGSNWYVFEDEGYRRDCWQCGKEFETRLKYNRYCTPECRDRAVQGYT